MLNFASALINANYSLSTFSYQLNHKNKPSLCSLNTHVYKNIQKVQD